MCGYDLSKNLKLYTVTFIASLVAILGSFGGNYIPRDYRAIFIGIMTTATILLIAYNVYIPEISTKNLVLPALLVGIVVGGLTMYTGDDKLEMTRDALGLYLLVVGFEYIRNIH